MLISLAWRNIWRNRRRSILTGSAVALGMFLVAWMMGLNEGAYESMISQAVETRLGHLQVMEEGYLDDSRPERVVADAESLAKRLASLNGIRAVSPRVLSEGMLARDSETAAVELLGVDPALERRASNVPHKLLTGEKAVSWCRDTMSDALDILGNDQELFDRWCRANEGSAFLPDDEPRAIALGSGVAEQLLVSVGDEITVQVVRAVDEAGPDGQEAGALSQRRLVVAGIFRTGNAGVDDRAVYMHSETLNEMLGTDGPNEIVLLLDDIRDLEEMQIVASGVVSTNSDVTVHSWSERNPGLASLIQMDEGNNTAMYFVLCFIVILGVVNATLMSVLERTKEFGVMLSVGMSRFRLFRLIMTEVGLLGALACVVGALFGAGIEAFGRYHGWYMEWFGYDAEALENMQAAGVQYETIYYAAMSPESAIGLVVGMYIMFLCAGFWPAVKAMALKPVEAMREQ